MAKLLTVEDDAALFSLISYNLSLKGHEIKGARCMSEALEAISLFCFDLILLDLILPDGRGEDLVLSIRAKTTAPILVLSALFREADKVRLLGLGADDYITKPFSFSELSARITAALRRCGIQAEENKRETYKALSLDRRGKNVFKNGISVPLTATEYALFCFFFENKGRVFSRSELINVIWGESPDLFPKRAVDMSICRLRSKICDDPKKPEYIKTKNGCGYYFCL